MKCNFILSDYLLAGEPKGVSDVRKDVIDTILKHEKLVKTEAAEIYSSIKRGSLKLEGHRRSLKKSKPAIKKGLKTFIAPTSSIAIKQKHLQTSAKYGSPKVKLACKGSVCPTDGPIAGQSQLYGSAQPTALEQEQLLKIQSSTEPPVQSSLSKQYKGQLATGLTSDVRESTSGALFHTRELSVTQSSSSFSSSSSLSPEKLFQKSPTPKSLPSKPLSSTSFSRNLPLNLPLLNEDIKPTTSVSEFPPQSLKTSVVSSASPLRKSPDELVEKKEPKKLIKEFPKPKPKQAIQERTSISTSIANPVLSKESCLSSTVHAYLQEQSFKEDFTKKGECRIYCIFYCKFNKSSIVKQFDLETKPPNNVLYNSYLKKLDINIYICKKSQSKYRV